MFGKLAIVKTYQPATQRKQIMKTVNKPFCKLCSYVHSVLKDYFAPYLVTCSYGTDRLCWTLKDAESWIKYCGKDAVIVGTYDYNVIVQRVQGA